MKDKYGVWPEKKKKSLQDWIQGLSRKESCCYVTAAPLGSTENHMRAWLEDSRCGFAPAPWTLWRWHGSELSGSAQVDSPIPVHGFPPGRFFLAYWDEVTWIQSGGNILFFNLTQGGQQVNGGPCSSALHWGVWGPAWGSKGSSKQREPGDALAVVDGCHNIQGEAGGAGLAQLEMRR